MRLAIIAHNFGFNDGQGRAYYEIARAAIRAGHSLTLVAESCSTDLLDSRDVQFIKVSTSVLPLRLLKNLSFAIRSALWMAGRRKTFDVIHANGFTTFAAADVIAAQFVHGAWARSPYAALRGQTSVRALYQRTYTMLNSLLEQFAFRRAQAVVAVSPNVKDELKLMGVPEEKIVVIMNGADVSEFRPMQVDRSEFSLPSDTTMFLFCGDIKTDRKNLGSVLRALAQVDGVGLAVAGGTAGSPYPQMAKDLGIAGRVYFLGHVKRMNELMAVCDAFVFPSRYDPFGIVVVEAMAAGIAVITAVTVGSYAVLGDKKWVLTDPEDVEGLASRMRTLAQDPLLRKQLGTINRTAALSCTWEISAAGYLALYDRILKDKMQGVTV